MLSVQALCKSFVEQVVFDDVSFVVGRGERVGVVGRNGSGKTTLFNIVLGEETADSGSVTTPSDYSFGHVSQHIAFSEPTVLDEACLALPRNEDELSTEYSAGWVEAHKAERILAGLGFAAADLGDAPEQLSGGFQVRLNLAKALLCEPSMLLLDEPTNYLDITSVRWLERFLNDWRGELMLITHDRTFMDSISTHTVGLHRHKARKVAGGTAKYYEQIAHEEEVYAKTLANQARKREEVERFIERFRYKATKARQVQSRVKALERDGSLDRLGEIEALDFEFTPADFPGKQMLEVEGLSFGYPGEADPLISDLSFSLGKNDRIAVVGPNGRGKTTLLNLLAGELNPDSGVVRPSTNVRLGYFGQTNVERLDPEKTVEEEIADGLATSTRGAARRLAGAMMFSGDAALKKTRVLSGGERSRVLLAKICARPANLLLLDEPSNHLDLESVETLMDAVDVFSGSVVIVTHNEALLHQVADRLIVFDGGRVDVFDGSYGEFLDKRGWASETDPIRGNEPAGPDAPIAETTAEKSAEKTAEKTAKKTAKKTERRRRAHDRAARAEMLRPIRRDIEKTEGRINDLEQRETELNEALVEASKNAEGNFEDLAYELRDVHELRDQAYAYLEKAEAELEAVEARIESEA